MSQLTIYPEHRGETSHQLPTLHTTAADVISAELRERGISFQQWPARANLTTDASPEEILAAYASDIGRYLEHLSEVGISEPNDIVREDVLDHLIALRKAKLSARSIARHLSAIRKFHVYLQDERVTEQNFRTSTRLRAVDESVATLHERQDEHGFTSIAGWV